MGRAPGDATLGSNPSPHHCERRLRSQYSGLVPSAGSRRDVPSAGKINNAQCRPPLVPNVFTVEILAILKARPTLRLVPPVEEDEQPVPERIAVVSQSLLHPFVELPIYSRLLDPLEMGVAVRVGNRRVVLRASESKFESASSSEAFAIRISGRTCSTDSAALKALVMCSLRVARSEKAYRERERQRSGMRADDGN
jgi:hypothetical protein